MHVLELLGFFSSVKNRPALYKTLKMENLLHFSSQLKMGQEIYKIKHENTAQCS